MLVFLHVSNECGGSKSGSVWCLGAKTAEIFRDLSANVFLGFSVIQIVKSQYSTFSVKAKLVRSLNTACQFEIVRW